MSYDLRDIKSVRIIAVANRLGMKLGFRGDRVQGECPFRLPDDGKHEPLSLVLSREENTFRCRSCGNTGSILDLVCQVVRIGPAEAIEWIGQNFCLPGVITGATPDTTSEPEQKEKRRPNPPPVPPTLNEAYKDFLELLGDPSAEAVAYMQSRGISGDTLERHGVTDIKGYHGTSSFLKDKYPPDVLRQAGLFDATGKLWFEDYPLILPYRRDGKVEFLQAHCMDSERTPRHLRPREAVPFLYNVDILRTLGDGDPVFLVEGVMDCLTLEERGYQAVAAASIAHFKPEWVKEFRRLEVYLVYAGGEGGERSAAAMAVLFAKSDLALRGLRLPRGHDVSSFFEEGGTQPEFEHLVQTAPRIKTAKPVLVSENRGSMAEFLDELRQHEKRTKAADHRFLGLDTGFPVLNQVCGGIDPLGLGQLCLVTGEAGCGKTTLCLQMAWQILENNEVAVLYVSYNEPKFVLRLRTLCHLSKIPANALLKGNVQADRLAAAVEEMSKWGKGFFAVEASRDTTVEILRDYCQRVRTITGERRVLVVIDPLEAIPVLGREAARTSQFEARASGLHFLSRELGIPIVLVSSKAAGPLEDRRVESPGGGGPAGCWEDMLLLLETDREAGRQRFPERDGHCVNVHVLKNRSGGVGTVAFDFVPECHHFVERGKGFPLAGNVTAASDPELAEIPNPFLPDPSEAAASRRARKKRRGAASTASAEAS